MRLTCVAVAGLCNRIRTLLGAQTLAEETGRELAVFWRKCKACGCEWSDLFLPSVNILTAEPKIEFPLTGPPEGREAIEARLRDAARSAGVRDVVFSAVYFGDPAQHIRHFDRLFRATPAIERRVAELTARCRRPVVGVHVRRGDFSAQRGSPVTASTDSYVRAVSAQMQAAGAHTIYLATDDGAEAALGRPESQSRHGVYEALAAALGAARIVRQEHVDLNRGNAPAIQDALVDLLVLRRCDAICGQRGSSFSGVAAIGKKSVMLAR